MAQKPRTRLSKEGRRLQLLDAAANIIEDQGFAGFTMEALAQKADVSNPLIYKYFDSRREIFEELLGRELDSYREKIRVRISKLTTFEEVVKIFVELNFEQAEDGNILSLLLSQPDLSAALSDKIDRNQKETGEFLLKKFTAENRKFNRGQALHLILMGSAASIAAAQRVNRSGRNRKRLIGNTVSFILGGFAASYKNQ